MSLRLVFCLHEIYLQIYSPDFDNNNELEIVVTLLSIGSLGILTAYNAVQFANQTICYTDSTPQPYSLAVANFNNDNRSDIIVANSGLDDLSILLGLDNGTFESRDIYPLGYGYRPYSIVVTDLDQDNWLDIVIACYGTDHTKILMKKCE